MTRLYPQQSRPLFFTQRHLYIKVILTLLRTYNPMNSCSPLVPDLETTQDSIAHINKQAFWGFTRNCSSICSTINMLCLTLQENRILGILDLGEKASRAGLPTLLPMSPNMKSFSYVLFNKSLPPNFCFKIGILSLF